MLNIFTGDKLSPNNFIKISLHCLDSRLTKKHIYIRHKMYCYNIVTIIYTRQFTNIILSIKFVISKCKLFYVGRNYTDVRKLLC